MTAQRIDWVGELRRWRRVRYLFFSAVIRLPANLSYSRVGLLFQLGSCYPGAKAAARSLPEIDFAMHLKRPRQYGNFWLGCELWQPLQLDYF